MKIVSLSWTPSVSIGVEKQVVNVLDVNTLEVYATDELTPAAGSFSARVPEGVVVRGSITTFRGAEDIVVVSNEVEVGFGKLQGATEALLSLVQPEPYSKSFEGS